MKLFRLTLAVFLIILSLSCTKEKDSKEEFAIFGLLGTVIANDSTQKASIIGTVHLIGEVQSAKVELYKLPANLLCSPEGIATETPLATTTTNEVGYYNLSVSVSALPQNGCLLATPQANSTHLNSFTAVKEKWENSPRGESSKYLASLIRFDVKSLVTKPTAYTSTSFGKTAGAVSTNVSTQYTVENLCSIAGTNYNGLLPHPDTIANGSSSEKYISCLDGVATENTCKTGTYNSALGTCSQSIGAYSSVVEKFSATDLSEVSGVLTAGGKTFDLVKDDTSCNSKTNGLTETNFCSVVGVCYNNQLYTRTCPSVGGVPLQYDPATASCTYPVNANCQERFVSRESAVFTANINTVSSMAQLQYWVDTFPQTESSLSSVLRSIGVRAGLSEAFCATLISRANSSVNSLLGSFVGLDNSASNAIKNVFRAVLAELTKEMGGDMDKALALLREDMSDGSLDGKTSSGKTVSAKLENGKTLTLDQNAYSGLVDTALRGSKITEAEANAFKQNVMKYSVLVSVSGLTGTGLVLQLNGGNDLTISQNGQAQFPVSLAYASSYSVTIKNGSTSDSCSINSGSSGTIGTANITLTVSCVAAVVRPTFNPPEGTYKLDQLIAISTTTVGATIYYTLDGTDPTTSSTQYTSPISIAGHTTTKTIKAIATKTGILNSSIGSATYTITYDPVAQPTFSPVAGTYNSDQSVTINSVAGATIYYTLDGSEPTTSSTQYSSPISIAGHSTTKTVKAMAVKTGLANSSASAAYVIAYDTLAQPTFSIPTGTYNQDQSITLSTITPGTTIYYTLDGSDPTTSSTQYSGAISIAGDGTSKTIKAFAIKTGMLNSSIASGTFTISYTVAAQPTFSLAAGTYTSDQSITLSTITPGATIHYTLDGSTPTTLSTQYSSAISIAGHGTSKTIKAIAVKSGFDNSSVASATYTIQYPPVPTPTFTPVAGVKTTVGNITISTTESGATIYYTTDGSTPTTSSTQYTVPLSNTWSLAGKTIKAIAVKTGFVNSSVLSGVFGFQLLKTGAGTIGGYTQVTGEDGQTKNGLARSYTDNGNGTVTDNVTGLVWQKCFKGRNNDGTCSDDAGVTDTAIWADAGTYCSGLSLAGNTWRLPTRQELQTLQDYGKTTNPKIDTTYFPSTVFSAYWWTSTLNGIPSMLDFGNYGGVFTGATSNTLYVRCVSGTSKGYTGNFTDNLDGTVNDNSTGLIWQKCSNGLSDSNCSTGTASTVTWADALTYCSGLNLAGKTWRLPNVYELRSIVDTTSFSPTITVSVFPATVTNLYWSSTTIANSTTQALSNNFGQGGGTFSGTKTDLNYVRCVAGP